MVEQAEIPFRNLEQLVGETLGGRFRLDRLIGRGGYGAVFAGWQASVDRPCAIKVLVPQVVDDGRNIRRFEAEARATSRLTHPHTVVIYDFGVDERLRLLYLVMEFIDGQSLRQRIGDGRALDVWAAAGITQQAALALQDAHDHGIVHRDVKPHNIMLTARGGEADFVKVIDFGIAKFLDDDEIRRTFERLTRTGTIIGTPAYMSPEQVRSEALDGRSDQYALAACAYHMLTGRPLFRGGGPVDIATKQLTQHPVPMVELNPAIPPAVDAVVLRALSKRSSDRFPTIAEFAAALVAATDRGADAPVAPAPAVDGEVSATVSLEFMDTLQATAEQVTAAAQTPASPAASGRPDPARALPLVPVESESRSARPTRWLALAAVPAAIVVVALTAERPRHAADEATSPIRSLGADAPSTTGTTPPRPEVDLPPAIPPEEEVAPARQIAPAPTAPVARKPASSDAQTEERALAPGKVTIVVVPWGTVWVDGAKRGDQPRQTLELAPGEHVVELRQSGETVARKTVDVHPGKNTMVQLNANP